MQVRLTQFLTELVGLSRARHSKRHSRRRLHHKSQFAVAAEILEDRCLLSTLVVNDDGGADHFTIQAAIDAAVAGDTILVTGGADRVHTEQGITVNQDVTIQGDAGGTQVIVQAAAMPGMATDRVFEVVAGTRAGIENLTVRYGRSNEGGGIRNAGTLNVTNSTISENRSGNPFIGQGGGIWNAGTVTVTNSAISQNSAGGQGGGIWNAGTLMGNLSTISQNQAIAALGRFVSGSGGGIHNSGTATVRNSTISENASTGGGGIQNSGTLTVENTTISENGIGSSSVGSSQGGGINNSNIATITNSTISQNRARSDGRVNGAGLFNSGTMTINNSTITQNTASTNFLSLEDVQGGGISNANTLDLTSTIVAGNLRQSQSVFSPTTVPGDVEGIIQSAMNNLIGDAGSSGGIIHGQNGNIVGNGGVGTIDINTVLDTTLRDNGGPTLTHALVPGSPAINNGANPLNLPFDQRGAGFPREQRGATDIGAFESALLPINPQFAPVLAFGSGGGIQAQVQVLNSALDEVFRLFPYDNFAGEVRVALGDVTGDGVSDIITAAGTGGGPHVKAFNGTNGQVVRSFFAYSPNFTGGVYVATADLNDDGQADILTGAGQGGGPHVRAWSGADNSMLFDFFAYNTLFTGGVRVAAGDINGDDRPDIITGAGPGGGSHVRVFDGTQPALAAAGINIPGPSGSFLAYPADYTGGVFVAANNTDQPNAPLIVTGSDQNIGAGAMVGIFKSPQQGNTVFQMPNNRGVRVAVLDFNRDGINDYLTATGPGVGSRVMLFSGDANQPPLPIGEVLFSGSPFGDAYLGGIFVAGSTFNPALLPMI